MKCTLRIHIQIKHLIINNFCLKKVFDVVLNGDLTIVSDLDIYEKVGRGVAHDEYVEFQVENNRILYQVKHYNYSMSYY